MKHIAIFFIRMYQSLQASFYLGACRFHPTCSHYAVEAFEKRGFFTGLWLTAYRLVRCQPFCKGGWDPVPGNGSNGTKSQPHALKSLGASLE